MSNQFDMEAFDKAVKKAGGYAVVADELGLTRQAVNLWKTQPIPEKRLAELVEIIDIPAKNLRPDLAKLFRKPRSKRRRGGKGAAA